VSQPEEQQWLRRAQQGDREAFAALVDCHWTSVHRWLFGLTRDAHTAEDLAQDVFLKAWLGLRSFQVGTHFRAWLLRIARNSYLDNKRRKQGSCRQVLPEVLVSREPDPVAILLSQETQTRIEAAMMQLSILFRAPLLLRVREGLSFQEIGAILDITEETARWRVCKARRLLLKALGQRLDTLPHDV